MAQETVILQWANGTPQIPEGLKIDGHWAAEPVTDNGIIKTVIVASQETIDALKKQL